MNDAKPAAALALEHPYPNALWPRNLGSPRFVLGLVTLTIAGLTFAGGAAARLGIPAIAGCAAYYLYRKSSVAYVGWVWWLFFLTPFLRRIVDFRSGYSDQNVILAAPYLAALACAPTLLSRADVWRSRSSLPFGFAFVCTLYGFAIGALSVPKKTLLEAALTWFCPLVFGFFMLCEVTSSRRDALIEGLKETFCWGTLLMGCYGIYQFIVAPRWDAMWIAESEMGSIGTPEPFGLRVFSTMNGPGAFAYCLLAGLMLLLCRGGILSAIAGGAGFIALLLSSVRSAWAALAVMLLLLAAREKQWIGKLVIAGAIVAGCVGAAMAIEPVRATVQDRFLSFKDVQGDSSYQERSGGYREMVSYAAEAPMGYGLGAMDSLFNGKTPLGSRDSGIWEIVMSLGWFGGAIYFAAAGMLGWFAWSASRERTQEQVAAACICLGLLFQIPMGSIVGITGLTIWTFAAIAVAPLHSSGTRQHEEVHGF